MCIWGYNSKWYNKFNMKDLIKHIARFTALTIMFSAFWNNLK